MYEIVETPGIQHYRRLLRNRSISPEVLQICLQNAEIAARKEQNRPIARQEQKLGSVERN